ncbi:MAG: 23S rRNA (uracil(1939)-C(5))-methyltransferase RlmD [Bacteroidetes bacterium]|nr:MAG: 23S rRNA (uracil(1939)-C(5))-methyltransferase RlmD [Bacteroidota bacterium]REK06987.1 MAG: 23S rRNA (uracil(1939)-C(5))-methyltransferase RlmD [Bacteroidota bacterium]REK33665.1 MAG: 23S rRNA (uracil(1939)-C(5))-methyltransferase RlmD [Bacteroidota bacterium]REK48651.1 MAG: 23S rRNA (uracil(1939)-C(5))-methyltransferase RlmD [Bacteroidota bacterium]
MGKTEESLDLNSLVVTDISDNGEGLARIDNRVVFIKGAVPGDVVNAHVYKKQKKFFQANLESIITPSPDRVIPFCTHFGVCGGCKWQHLSYEKQVEFKQKHVYDALVRIGKLEIPGIEPILGSVRIKNYRNRLDFSCADKKWLTKQELQSGLPMKEDVIGFHVPGRFDKVLSIENCHLMDERVNLIRNEIRSFAVKNKFSFFDPVNQTGFLRDIIFRHTSTDEWMLIVVFREEKAAEIELLMNHIITRFPFITSLLYIINHKRNDTIFDLPVNLYSGKDHITEKMGDLKFKISAKSFYQTNSYQAWELYKVAARFAGLSETELVYDLYTGTGTIANFIASRSKHVIGIDNVPDAIEDAKENSLNNGIKNTTFIAGDLKATLTNEFVAKHGTPDVIITDPPRSGMHPDTVTKMAEFSPRRIVYVSCNPSTQARDIAMISDKYRITRVQPVDMFPHTTHVENVVLLEKK